MNIWFDENILSGRCKPSPDSFEMSSIIYPSVIYTYHPSGEYFVQVELTGFINRLDKINHSLKSINNYLQTGTIKIIQTNVP